MNRYHGNGLLFTLLLALALATGGCANKPPEATAPERAPATAATQTAPPPAVAGSETGSHPSAAERPALQTRQVESQRLQTKAIRNYRAKARAKPTQELTRAAMPAMAAAAPAAKNGHVVAGTATPPDIDSYMAKLWVDQLIKMPGTGSMKVWIGYPQYVPADIAGMVSNEAAVPAIGNSAKVVPYAPDFQLDRQESECFAISPQGSDEIFTLTPTRAGKFNVGAKIYLYANGNCAGVPVPKVPPEMKVTVKVSVAQPVITSFWEQLRKWLIEIIAIFFAVLLLLLRKQIRRWFGLDVDR